MLMLDTPVIRQRLFTAKTPDGSRIYLAFLLDDHCAIVNEDGHRLESFGSDDQAMELAVERFLSLSRLSSPTVR